MCHVLLTMICGIFDITLGIPFCNIKKKFIIYIFPFFLFVERRDNVYFFNFVMLLHWQTLTRTLSTFGYRPTTNMEIFQNLSIWWLLAQTCGEIGHLFWIFFNFGDFLERNILQNIFEINIYIFFKKIKFHQFQFQN
jgi:hypothetical protein